MAPRVLLLALAALACGLGWARRPGAPLVLIRPDAPLLRASSATAPDGTTPDPTLASWLARATPDDVARGVGALRRASDPVLALSATQEATLAPLLAEGRDARAARDALRTRRRLAEEALLEASARLALALPHGAGSAGVRP